jgi:hypothetical protein
LKHFSRGASTRRPRPARAPMRGLPVRPSSSP